MTAISNVAQVKEELELMLAKPKPQSAQEIPDLEDSYIQDFAEIGSLMTDKPRCIASLADLNSHLVIRAEQANIRRKGNLSRQYKNRLSEEKFKYKSIDNQSVSAKFKKHGNILKDYLDVWENINGFNKGNEEGGLPARAPLLTGFVRPNDFRKYLLKHGYHWTDVGVAGGHGEFTHRLHWFIIVKEATADPNWLNHSPVELFKKCGEDCTVRGGNNNTIWDRIFDHLTQRVIPDGPTKGHEVVFRKAELLHAFLREEATRSRQDLWALAQIINSRAGRVELINTLNSPNGTKRLDLDIEGRQDDMNDQLLLRGDETQKIVWQRLQEGNTRVADEFLRV